MQVNVLKSASASTAGPKRILIADPVFLDYARAVEIVGEQRPELKDRLVDPKSAPVLASGPSGIEATKVWTILGFKSWMPWEKTILDTINSLVALEKRW